MIQIRSISKTYGKKQNTFQALRDVTVDIPDGASVAIVGRSGSGKSTLMHAMSGLDRPDTGQVLIDGQDILRLSAKDMDTFRSKTIGFIFQAFFVQGNESCQENVSLPLEIAKVPKEARKALIEGALAKVELMDKLKERARNLSGGQKQRLAIARAIVNTPRIIFADEPTGNLDSATGEMVEQLLFSYNQNSGTTLVIVTHDPELASKCSMQIYIKDGQIEAVRSAAPPQQQTQPQPQLVTPNAMGVN